MGNLKECLLEFQSLGEEYYSRIIQILDEEYCWKCPQCSNKEKTYCHKVEAWISLNLALEKAIKQSVPDADKGNLDLLVVKYLEKNNNKLQRTLKYDEISIIKLKEKIKPSEDENCCLLVRKNPSTVKVQDMVLLPQECPLSTYWFSRMKLVGVIPFKLARINNIFTKNGFRYIKLDDGTTVSMEFILGLVLKKLGPDDPLMDYF